MPGSACCCRSKGQDLLRTKGILNYANEDRRFAFQAVHMIADGDFIGAVEGGRPACQPAGVHRPQPEPPAAAARVRELRRGLRAVQNRAASRPRRCPDG